MKILLDLDDALLKEVMILGSFPTKRAAVTTALEEFLKLLKRRELAAMRGKVHWEGELDQWRVKRAPEIVGGSQSVWK